MVCERLCEQERRIWIRIRLRIGRRIQKRGRHSRHQSTVEGQREHGWRSTSGFCTRTRTDIWNIDNRLVEFGLKKTWLNNARLIELGRTPGLGVRHLQKALP
jgi:hypothetical protein